MPFIFKNDTYGTIELGCGAGKPASIHETYTPEVQLVEVAGRRRPVSRYGIGGTCAIRISGVAFDKSIGIKYATKEDIDKLKTCMAPWQFSDGSRTLSVVVTAVGTSSVGGPGYETVDISMQEVDS